MHQTSFDRPFGEPAVLDTSVFNPVNLTQTHWNDLSKTATVMHYPGPQSRPPSRPAGPGGGVGSGAGRSLKHPACRCGRARRRWSENS